MALCVGAVTAAALTVGAAHLSTYAKTYGSPVTCTLTAVADSTIKKAQANTNFGTATTIDVNSSSLATQRGFARFDLTGCSPTIPSGAIVQTASLRLTISAAAAQTRTYDIYCVTGAWTEAGVTWNTQPAVAAGSTAATTVNALTLAGTVMPWTVTSDVQSFVTGANSNLGWRVNDHVETDAVGTGLSFQAREAASGRPQLAITYVA
jgi:hypothetical protein